MSPVRPLKLILAVALAASLTTVFAVSNAFAASASERKPLILDSQSGISDGQSGTVLQTAPLSRQPIVGAQPIAAPAELAPNSSMPYIVAPYIQLPVGGGTSPQPQPQLQPRPVPRSQ
ncbi:hypothetical protein A6V36_24475 [Paraburkholderia ginsengiterrae]|uniref:Uncharacterized protein n=1 Tax=Paraburkholderia ginsengiterrae TaxID=1462993 RepID=A0A1A9NBD2_9BURK|nr:hypothetical protein [Paraburkholderia ginsengiterrae]OAJ61528.1 hypothetical protein A6V36_24475 [Paraburkholderia ginsengiterrae]OAJ62929.1 hypothetical protein A6V37_22245 [Paraburkholderia ginsengiterrae]